MHLFVFNEHFLIFCIYYNIVFKLHSNHQENLSNCHSNTLATKQNTPAPV